MPRCIMSTNHPGMISLMHNIVLLTVVSKHANFFKVTINRNWKIRSPNPSSPSTTSFKLDFSYLTCSAFPSAFWKQSIFYKSGLGTLSKSSSKVHLICMFHSDTKELIFNLENNSLSKLSSCASLFFRDCLEVKLDNIFDASCIGCVPKLLQPTNFLNSVPCFLAITYVP